MEKFLEDMKSQRKSYLEKVFRDSSPANTLTHFLLTPAKLRALSALVNIEALKKIDDAETIIYNLTTVETALLDMATIIEKFKECCDGNREPSADV